MRQYSKLDQFLIAVDNGLKTLAHASPHTGRPNPANQVSSSDTLDEDDKKHAIGCMRVNHTGEICAQALYQGQALFARSLELRTALYEAAQEENDHLHWCQSRLKTLEGRTSYLDPLWYCGAFTIGVLGGLASDKVSLGFLMETEYQVSQHLDSHLISLPQQDASSRAIVKQMQIDELAHAAMAKNRGAVLLPKPIRMLMRLAGATMTKTSYYC